jgi:hypothetical protein
MKTKINTLLGAVLSLLVLPRTTNAAAGPCAAVPQFYDLKADWSDTQNPNGTWSYREGESLLIANPVPWVGANYNANYCAGVYIWPPAAPAMRKVTGDAQLQETVGVYSPALFLYPDLLEDGDVLVVPGAGGNILWTAPESGTINISGATWGVDPAFACIGTAWTLSLNGSLLSGGDRVDECSNPRSSPFDLSLGSGGAAGLQNISLQAGDQLVLAFHAFGFPLAPGFPIGVSFTITLTADSAGDPNYDAIIWHQPLARNGGSEDTDPSANRTVKYRFKRGSTIPIQIHALNCAGADVTSNANVIGTVTVFGDSNCDGAIDDRAAPIDFNGVGGGGGVMDKIGSHLKYNLDTKSLPTTTQCYILRVTVTDTSTGEEKFEEVLLQAK